MQERHYKVNKRLRWISVDVSLPPFDTRFLGVSNGKISIGFRQKGIDRTNNISLVSMTHWMPLPPLPKQPLSNEEMELERLVDTIRIQTTIEAINTLKKWKKNY